jgi:UPF0755 protein
VEKSGKKKVILIILAVVVTIIILTLIVAFSWYNISLKPISSSDEVVRVVIPEGTTTTKIANILYEEGIARNKYITILYTKLNKISNLQAGKYDLNKNTDLKENIEHIANGDVANDEVKITFVEGKNMRAIAKKIAESTNNTEEDVFNLLEDEEYIDSLIEKYWFLTDEIKDDQIYYPLEGYLLPDTYIFENEDVSVKTIFNVILNFMDKKLTAMKEEIENSNLTVHQMLTLASMAELEGNSTSDRAEIIGVFYNRLNAKMSLGSDVTTYYAFKVDMGERDLSKQELNTYNAYNTRGPNMAGKIPIGPICNPSTSAIEAALNPTSTDAFYFVADKNGKVYFSKTNDEHNKTIQKLKKEGLWYNYDD